MAEVFVSTDSKPRFAEAGFSLIEVLVVVAIIGLLVSILVPSLTQARAQTRLTVCKTQLHQLGLGINSYAQTGGFIPFGPEVEGLPPFLEPNDGRLATNQIWTGPQPPAQRKMGLGLLLGRNHLYPDVLYCPGDDSNDPVEERAKVTERAMSPAYSSYLYRQLQATDARGRIDALGRNDRGRDATALALDVNSVMTIDPSYYRTNHKARRVNALYVDGSVLGFDNRHHTYSMRDQDLADLVARRAEIFEDLDARR